MRLAKVADNANKANHVITRFILVFPSYTVTPVRQRLGSVTHLLPSGIHIQFSSTCPKELFLSKDNQPAVFKVAYRKQTAEKLHKMTLLLFRSRSRRQAGWMGVGVRGGVITNVAILTTQLQCMEH